MQRPDDASQQSMSNSGTPTWSAIADEPMDYSQPIFGGAAPVGDAARQEHGLHRVSDHSLTRKERKKRKDKTTPLVRVAWH